MTKAIIVDRKPAKVDLKAGETYYWCSCGKSKNQPFCDGSHRGTTFTPRSFTVEESGEAYLCLCKHTKNAPFCDGSHTKLPEENMAESDASTG